MNGLSYIINDNFIFNDLPIIENNSIFEYKFLLNSELPFINNSFLIDNVKINTVIPYIKNISFYKYELINIINKLLFYIDRIYVKNNIYYIRTLPYI